MQKWRENDDCKYLLHVNHKTGTLQVEYKANQSASKSGLDLSSGNNFDMAMCIGNPTMRARIQSYEGTGYATACAWIQIVTRREFATLDALEPANVEPSVDNHPTLAELGSLAKLDWVADTFLLTMPT